MKTNWIERIGKLSDEERTQLRLRLGLPVWPSSPEPSAVSDDRLIAFVCPPPGRTLVRESLRAFLQDKLPDYMLPSAYFILDRLPLMPNGKVDRQSLFAVQETRTDTTEQTETAASDTEHKLAKIWHEVLKSAEIKPADNFFEVGGHSLLAIQVLARVRATFAIELPMRTLFENPTLSALSRAIDERRAAATTTPPTTIERISRESLV